MNLNLNAIASEHLEIFKYKKADGYPITNTLIDERKMQKYGKF